MKLCTKSVATLHLYLHLHLLYNFHQRRTKDNPPSKRTTQQTKLYYRNIITILSVAVFNISSAYYGNVAQENTTFTNITLPNNIIWTFHMKHYMNILSFALFNISSTYYGNIAQENTTFPLIILPNNILWTFLI